MTIQIVYKVGSGRRITKFFHCKVIDEIDSWAQRMHQIYGRENFNYTFLP